MAKKTTKTTKINEKLVTDWIHYETTEETIEIHRGRGGYNWSGQKGKNLDYTIPVLVEKTADEILKKIYNCEHWQRYGKGKETSLKSIELSEYIWQCLLPNIDVRSLKTVEKSESRKEAMVNTQIKGEYIVKTKKKDFIIGSNECYTFYQSVEMVVNWFLNNIDKNYFKNKVVYMNCDDTKSAFWIFFYNNFDKLGLKEIIGTHYDKSGLSYGNSETDILQFGLFDEFKGYILRYDGKRLKRIPPEKIESDYNGSYEFHGDYKEKICMHIAKYEADIIMTNPPFGKEWEQYVNCMLGLGKKLIIWGNGGAALYNWFMPFLNEHKIFIIDKISNVFESDYYLTPNYWKKRALGYIYTTEDLSKIYKPNKKYYSTKKKMLKDGTAWYARLTTMSGPSWKKECEKKDFMKKLLEKEYTAKYEMKYEILCCDKAMIPTDTDEILAVSVNIIKHGILNDGYKIIDYCRYCPIKDKKMGFARILIQKK